VTLVEGTLPGPGDALVGRLAAVKSDVDPARSIKTMQAT